ncbi:hypothetical protein HRbin09_00695 [bacterium HR09]|nr:hypothetical protein HRbin09_00695 [bacterium HR09]
MDDEGLRKKRFHKPPGLEKAHQTLAASFVKLRGQKLPAAKEKPHEGKGGIIEERAHRANENHKALDVFHVPAKRLGHLLFVHAVGGNSGLGKIVKQVVGQDLHRLHGEKRHEIACSQHRKHVAEVGAGSHADVLDDVGKNPAPLHDAFFQHQKAFFQKHDVRRFFCHIHPGIHGNAHIRSPQGRRVVDAVPQKPHHMPVAAQRRYHLFFLGGRELHKNLSLLHHPFQLFGGKGSQLRASDHPLHGKPHVPAHLFGDQGVVAGEHLHLHPSLLQQLQRFIGGFLGGIKKRNVAQEDEIAFVFHGKRGFFSPELAVGDAQHSKTVAVQLFHFLE